MKLKEQFREADIQILEKQLETAQNRLKKDKDRVQAIKTKIRQKRAIKMCCGGL